jgi:hypothetical protein
MTNLKLVQSPCKSRVPAGKLKLLNNPILIHLL